MKKTTYLLLLALITTHFFDIKPLGNIMAMNSGVIGTITLYLWIYFGYKKYRSESNRLINNKTTKAPIIWVIAGIFFSFLPAYIYHGQSFLTSLIAYRETYIWFFGIAILYVSPKPKEIITSLTAFSLLFVVASLLRTIDQSLFYYSTVNWTIDSFESKGEILFGDGLVLMLIPLYYYSEKYRNDSDRKSLVYILFFITSLFIIQNRSTLFVAVVIVMFMVITKKSKYRLLSIGLFSVAAVVFFVNTINIWSSLITETTEQIDNEDYNRVKAFTYFMYDANKSWTTFLFGNGFLSTRSTSLSFDLFEMGIVNSDLGLIGFWNQFGLIPIFVFIVCIIKSLTNKGTPFFIKAIGFHILCGAFTMSYFARGTSVLLFIFYYYMFVYYSRHSIIERKKKQHESIVPNSSLS